MMPQCTITRKRITSGDKILFEASDGIDFFQSAYDALTINYPRYFKVDHLSKLALLASAVIFPERIIEEHAYSTGLVLSTHHGSLDTDMRFWESTKQVASPSLFVYTLANVMAGELCIRYGIKGENYCFATIGFQPQWHAEQSKLLRHHANLKQVLHGYANYINGYYEANFWLESFS